MVRSYLKQNNFMHYSKWHNIFIFPSRGGCRQGSPIFPYLLILCDETLGILIRGNEDIKCINKDGEEYKTSHDANDISLITDGSLKSLFKSDEITNHCSKYIFQNFV